MNISSSDLTIRNPSLEETFKQNSKIWNRILASPMGKILKKRSTKNFEIIKLEHFDYLKGIMSKIRIVLFAICLLAESEAADSLNADRSNVFLLAQNYTKDRQFTDAIKNYEKRIAMGGNQDEIFWSLYSIAILQEEMREPYETVVSGYTKAFQFSNNRAEPLYRLAAYFRNSGNPFLGYLTSQFALTLAPPQVNGYCESWIYDFGALFEFSNCAFWVGRYDEAYDACLKLMGIPNLPPDILNTVNANRVCVFDKMYPPRFEGYFEEYKDRRLELIAKYLPENPVIFEAGGHYGTDTVRFAKEWPKAKIVSFEPNPNAYEIAKETTKGFSNIQRVNLALNTNNGKAKMNLSYGPSGDKPHLFEGASSLLEPSEEMKNAYVGPVIEVLCVRLDDWCKNNQVDHFDFMWLDLEGMELQVVQSSPKILDKVKVIYTETNFRQFRVGTTQYPDLKAFLEKAGFRLLAHWYNENFQGNAIFVKKEIFDLGFEK